MKTVVVTGVVSVVVSAMAGWCISGAMVVPRIEAIERSLARIELRLDAVTGNNAKVASK